MPELKTKHVVTPSIKLENMPEDVQKAAKTCDADLWFYATVETPDRENDIVRVAGIDTKSFAQNGSIKFIMAHNQGPLADGRLPVLGKAVNWVKTIHKDAKVPALAVGIKFADTPLAQETKSLYEGGFLSDVSIGFEPKKATPLKDGGFDFEECAIGELSACITGMNQLAGVVRAFDAEQEDQKVAEVEIEQFVDAITEKIATKHQEQLEAFKTEICKRLDDVEDTLSLLPKNDGSQHDREGRQPSISLDKLRALLAQS